MYLGSATSLLILLESIDKQNTKHYATNPDFFVYRDLRFGLNAGKNSSSLLIYAPATPNPWKKKRNLTAQVLPVQMTNLKITMESSASRNPHILARNPNLIMPFITRLTERNIR